MRSANIRFSSRLNYWFYGVFGVLFLSGVLWLVAHYLTGRRNDFDMPQGSLEPWLLKIHGAAAMMSLVLLGALIPSHMARAWEQRRNRATAVVLATVCLSMIISGYGLYYFGSEEVRPFVSGFHSITGCLLPLVLVWHIQSGRKHRKLRHFKKPFAYRSAKALTHDPQQTKETFLN